MTDRVRGVYVAFMDDVTKEDAEDIINAIDLLRGVLTVKADVADPMDFVAHQRARRQLADKLLDVLKEG